MNLKVLQYAVWRETDETPKPNVAFVPAMERRRLTGVERAALSTAWEVRAEHEIPVVFASRWGEIGVTLKLMKQFQADGEMSPAGFSASVHNAAPGAFSLLTKNHAPYTAIAARSRSLEAGLLEALAQNKEVLYVYAEESTPEFYQSAFGEIQKGCSVALRLNPDETGDIRCTFRHQEAPAASFEALVAFLNGTASSFSSSDFELVRVGKEGA